MISGKEEKAAKLLQKLRPEGTDVQEVITTYKEINKASQEVNRFEAIVNKPVMKRLALILTLCFINGLTGNVNEGMCIVLSYIWNNMLRRLNYDKREIYRRVS